MKTLPDRLQPKMDVMFVGTNPGKRSASIGHYFAGKSNMFWKLLFESKLTSERLYTETDFKIQEYNYGLTDVVKRPTRSTSDLNKKDGNGAKDRLDKIIERYEPSVVAFVGKAGFRYYLDDNKILLKYGKQKRNGFDSEYFLLPSSSGQSYADTSYKEKLYWYSKLRNHIKKIRN